MKKPKIIFFYVYWTGFLIMKKGFTFIFIFCFSFVLCQHEIIPRLASKSGELTLTEQLLEVNVVGTVADVRLYQTFTIAETDSAFYLYPVSTTATLSELTVYYPDRIFTLESQNMENIRRQVAAQNKKGKNIITANSTDPYFVRLNLPDPPENEEIKVLVKYVQNLNKEEAVKSLTIPSFISKNYKTIPENFHFQFNIISATPIVESHLKPYQAKSNEISKKYQTYSYQGKLIDEPIEIQYNARGDKADAGMLVYEDKGCRYILGTVEPPKIIEPEEIAPREYIFVMDISGSMVGFPFETSKELITRILDDLKPEEKFNLLFFAGESDFFAEKSVYATTENKMAALEIINRQSSTGKTRLSDAMKKVYAYKPDKEFNRIVVLVTDGNLKPDNGLYSDLKSNLSEAQYFVFGIGYEIGRVLLQQLAHIAGTTPVLISEQPDAQPELERFFEKIRTPILRHIVVQSKELNLSETYPNQFNGFLSNHASSFVSKECSGLRNPKLILTGVSGEDKYSEEFSLPQPKKNDELAVLKYLWAREKIDFLLQEEERCGQACVRSGRYRNEIIKLGEELNISTPYTSFVEGIYENRAGEKGRKESMYNQPKSQITFQNDFDSDFDKIPNTQDECPFDKGLASRRGCPKTKVEKMTQEINRMMQGIEFDFDSYAIKPEFHDRLNIAASIINDQKDTKYIVEGHTDAAGTPEYNLELSLNRARTVVNYLKEKGVKAQQLKIIGKGDTELLHPECRPQEICSDQKNYENRRVVFKIDAGK